MSLSRFKLIALNFKALPVSFISAKKLHSATNVIEESTNTASMPHTPVMVKEVVELLHLKEGDLYLDMTFGAGGHCSALLEKVPGLRVLVLDRDPHAEKYMKEVSEKYSNEIIPLIGKFSDLPDLLEKNNIEFGSIDGILLDLGCSSMQLDIADRGFSFLKSGPIDMRMDGDRISGSITAGDVIAHATEKDLYNIFKIYGEERKSAKIARAIIHSRYNFQPLKTTKDLADLVETVYTAKPNNFDKQIHAATKIFQALRIFVNNELNELHYGLMLAYHYLKQGGRIVTLSFHSLETKIIKAHFKNLVDYDDMYISAIHTKTFHQSFPEFEEKKLKEYWSEITKKSLVPSIEETFLNQRSRSAKLRAAMKN